MERIRKFKFIDKSVLRILHLKKGQKEVGNISYYRESNSESNDIMDNNLLKEIQIKYPESWIEIVDLKTDTEKHNYEYIYIRKLSVRRIAIHWITDIDLTDMLFTQTGKTYPSKKTEFAINVATTENEYLIDLENYYEILIPASDYTENLFTSFIPVL